MGIRLPITPNTACSSNAAVKASFSQGTASDTKQPNPIASWYNPAASAPITALMVSLFGESERPYVIRRGQRMGDVIKDFNSILDILEADLSLTYQPLQSETLPDRVQQLRRAYFRTALTYIEAIVFQLKRLSLSNVDSRVSFTKGELAMLHEETYSLRQNGIVNVRPAYLPLLDNMKFTAEMFAKAHRSKFCMPHDDSGWGDLRQAQSIRNRITHPKNPTDLEIADNEMDVLGRALARFRRWRDDVFDSIKG